MSTVIKIENVSKQYRLGSIGTNTLRGDLQRWWYNLRGLPDPTLIIGQENTLSASSREPHTARPEEYVWALKDINLEVHQGEVLGIIGKNGAGKSTLLKLLSRVTAPTTGSIKVKGRIASLLEVGTGFHPDLTGRENIFLNGAILGMTKTEIRKKFDEIVDFAGVAKYIDTPVKRYSSGMYVRLAFAVAAHLEPEILIVDEVLAVGDAEFQKKALGKMQDVSTKEGRTVLFVSHNMGAIRTLCTFTVLLDKGIIMEYARTEDAIQNYLSIPTNKSLEYKAKKESAIYILYSRLIDSANRSTNIYDFNDLIRCEVFIKMSELKRGTVFTFVLQNMYKNRIFSSDHSLEKMSINKDNVIKFIFKFPELPYAPGIYSVIMGLHIPNAVSFEINDDMLPFEIIDRGSSLTKYTAFTGDMLSKGTVIEI